MNFVNQSGWDRILRILAGLLMLWAGWSLAPEGLAGAALRVFGLIPLVTGLLGWSPIYAILGKTTRRARADGNGARGQAASRNIGH